MKAIGPDTTENALRNLEQAAATLQNYKGDFREHWLALTVAQEKAREALALLAGQRPDDKLPCGHRRANEVGDQGGTPYCEVCRESARARLDEFNYILANRPIDPIYWDTHHRRDLEDQVNR